MKWKEKIQVITCSVLFRNDDKPWDGWERRIFLCVRRSKLYRGSLAPRVRISEGGGIWWVYLRLRRLGPLTVVSGLASLSREAPVLLLSIVRVSLPTLILSSSTLSSSSSSCVWWTFRGTSGPNLRLFLRFVERFGPFSKLVCPPGGLPIFFFFFP